MEAEEKKINSKVHELRHEKILLLNNGWGLMLKDFVYVK
jgi:hypothetical protein